MKPKDRAAINRENSRHSTGPKTVEGKQRSSENSLKHGLYSQALILPWEDENEYEELRSGLHREHQPATPTETLLVDQMAQSAWRIRRFRLLETRALESEKLDVYWLESGLFALAERSLASAERAFHRALTALIKLRPRKAETRTPVPTGSTPETEPEALVNPIRIASNPGFVPQNFDCSTSEHSMLETQPRPANDEPLNPGFVPANSPHLC